MKTSSKGKPFSVNTDVKLRKFPYPYRAMLAICSDLDSTLNRHVYLEIMRFLNTTEMTSMGLGVNLEVGNSIHFHAKPQRFSYWNTDDAGREIVQTLIRSGHIDCLHSFGELIYTREEAEQALKELEQHDCHLEVWVDHGGAVTNFGHDIMAGHGDEVGHPAYHADLTIKHGIRYVCLGRGTSITGQDVPAKLSDIFNWHHPVDSGRTLLKETTKRGLARIGNKKYAMHGPNETIRPTSLQDGHPVYEFMRCNPHWGGISSCNRGDQIGEVLTNEFLTRLEEREGTCILYTHLGRVGDPAVPFNEKAVAAFRRLARKFHAGKILVTTTRRLLDYRRTVREVDFDVQQNKGVLHIDLKTKSPKNWIGELNPADLSGLTFYVPDPQSIRLTINEEEVTDIRCNTPDHMGRLSVSLSRPRLEFPEI